MYHAKNSATPLRLHLQFFGEETGAEDVTPSTEQEPIKPPASDEDTKNVNVEAQPDAPKVDDLIKRAVDRATNKIGNDNKKLKEQLDKVNRERLSTDELKQLEASEREATLAMREAQIVDKENRYYAIKSIKAAGLDTGDETALELVDFVMGETSEDIDTRVEAFSKLLSKFVKNNIESTFKENGRIPNKASTGKNDAQANIGTVLGKMSLANNTASKAALDYYTGGKK